jgi:Galactose oxidase, central domain
MIHIASRNIPPSVPPALGRSPCSWATALPCWTHVPGARLQGLRRGPNGATIVRMTTRLRIVLSCLLVASLGGCSSGSQATSPPDAPTVTGGIVGAAGTGGGPGGIGGGSGGTRGQLSTATSATPPLCIPGASVACACVTGQTGAQTCTSAGTFATCVCAAPAIDAGGADGADGAATSPSDAPAATGGGDAPSATGGTGTGGTASGAGTGGSAVSSSSGGAGSFGGTAGAGGGGGRPIMDAAADQKADVRAVPDAPADAGLAADAYPDVPLADAYPDGVVLQGVFVPTGSMTVARYGHTATLLPGGKVLIAGGDDGDGDGLASAELYDPTAGTFAITGSMSVKRYSHTATLLPSGKVLVAGGDVSGTAELYDPAAGTFTATGNMTVGRGAPAATLLGNGKVLIAGGRDIAREPNVTSDLASAELYDPAAGTFTATGNMTVGRVGFTATLLPSGQVLMFSGYYGTYDDSNSLGVADLYDPVAGTFTIAYSCLVQEMLDNTATLLGNGKVLIAGGYNSVFLASAGLCGPAVEVFTATGNMTEPRAYHTATLLPNGMVLIAGGENVSSGAADYLASAEVYDPSTGTFTATGSMPAARMRHTATLLPSGKVLIAGGVGSSAPWASAELFEE